MLVADENNERVTKIIEGGKLIFTLDTVMILYVCVSIDTYPISDNESTLDSISLIDTNIVKLPQEELNRK